MATFASAFRSQPVNVAEGNSAVMEGSVTPTAATTADVIRFGPFGPGVKPYRLTVINADLDSNGTPLLAVKAGYSYVDASAAPAGADEAFIATGSTILRAVSPADGNQFVVKPFEIQKAWYLDIVVTASAATFAAGEVTAIVEAEAVGAK